MSRANSNAFRISLVAFMIALCGILEMANSVLPLRVPWGMSIDFVALPVMIVFFILGTRYSIVTALGMYAVLCVIGFAGFVGSTMKFFATVPMVIVLGALTLTPLKDRVWPAMTYSSIPKYVLAAALALVARCAVASAVNYFWAIPIFFAMPIDQVIENMFFGSIWGFIAFVSGMNITQGVIDLAVAWIIVFGFGIGKRFAPKA